MSPCETYSTYSTHPTPARDVVARRRVEADASTPADSEGLHPASTAGCLRCSRMRLCEGSRIRIFRDHRSHLTVVARSRRGREEIRSAGQIVRTALSICAFAAIDDLVKSSSRLSVSHAHGDAFPRHASGDGDTPDALSNGCNEIIERNQRSSVKGVLSVWR